MASPSRYQRGQHARKRAKQNRQLRTGPNPHDLHHGQPDVACAACGTDAQQGCIQAPPQ